MVPKNCVCVQVPLHPSAWDRGLPSHTQICSVTAPTAPTLYLTTQPVCCPRLPQVRLQQSQCKPESERWVLVFSFSSKAETGLDSSQMAPVARTALGTQYRSR